MRILICTGIFPPDIGGPAQYAKAIAEEFSKRGIDVQVITYADFAISKSKILISKQILNPKFQIIFISKILPKGIRHLLYFLELIPFVLKTDLIIALDTFSVGFPTVLAGKIFGKKTILRVGGDFLWETCVEKTGNLMTLKDFYAEMPRLTLKQRLIYFLQKFALRNCAALGFSTTWQKEIFEKNYKLNPKKSFIIENYYGEKIDSSEPKEKNFIFAGRPLKLKNINLLKEIFHELGKEKFDVQLEIIENAPYEELMEKIKKCYAVILPSISDISPNFILDAIRANKPFILTKETGLYDKLKGAGIFVDPFNKNDIKEKILLLADDKNYKEYKEKVKNFNFTHSWEEIANEFLEIYKKL